MDFSNCTPHREGTIPQIISCENNCRHIGKNPSRNYIKQYKIDGEVIPSSTDALRCDYLLLVEHEKKKAAYFIELKGSDLKKAIQQIEASVSQFSPYLKDYKIFRRIVYYSGTTDVQNQTIIRWKARHGAIIKQRVLEENVSL